MEGDTKAVLQKQLIPILCRDTRKRLGLYSFASRSSIETIVSIVIVFIRKKV